MSPPPQPAPVVLLVHADLYSRSVLKQMTPGFPAIDHKHKNTPTAYCSHLPLQRHPLCLLSPPLLLQSYFSCCVLFRLTLTSSQKKNPPQTLTPSDRFMCLSRVSCLASFCSCTVTGAWKCFSAFSTTESSLCQRVGVEGGEWVEWVGAKWKDWKGRDGRGGW